MILVSSNPTNLVLSSASGINFIYFSGWTIIPAILSGIALYLTLAVQFFPRKNPELIPGKLETPEVYPRGELKDLHGAVFKATLLAVTLLALIISSVFVKGLYVWWVTVPAALIALLRDIVHDVRHRSSAAAEELELREDEPMPHMDDDVGAKVNGKAPEAEAEVSMTDGQSVGAGAGVSSGRDRRWTVPRFISWLQARLPTVCSVAVRMPWPLVPFAFSFFILVNSLSSSGWINVWAGWMSIIVRNNDVTAIFFVGFLSIILCNASHEMHVIKGGEADSVRYLPTLVRRSFSSASSTTSDSPAATLVSGSNTAHCSPWR